MKIKGFLVACNCDDCEGPIARQNPENDSDSIYEFFTDEKTAMTFALEMGTNKIKEATLNY